MKKNKIVVAVITITVAIIAGITGAIVNINMENQKINATIDYSEEQVPASIEDDKGEVV